MKHKIDVPKGCKVISVEIISVETTDKMVVVKFEKEENEFKENDIVTTTYCNKLSISIFKNFVKNNGSCGRATFKCSLIVDTFYLNKQQYDASFDTIRLSNEEEKQLLFDKLKEKCLMFDGENVVRWRAGRFKEYYNVYGSGLVFLSKDAYIVGDEHKRRYNIGNYFPTREMAEAFQKQYIELLNNFHKNL